MWVRLDDGFFDHPKVLKAGDNAAHLYVCGLTYCARHLTDGFIPLAAIPRLTSLPKPEQLAHRLVDARLWEPVDDGYRVHDYGHYQPSADEVSNRREAILEKRRAAGIVSGLARRNKARAQGEQNMNTSRTKCSPDCSPDVQHVFVQTGTHVQQKANPVPVPINTKHPFDPPLGGQSNTLGDSGGALELSSPEPTRRAKRACALPDGFAITDKHREFAASQGVDDLESELAKFRDHHVARGTLSKDWDASFRTWLRNALTFSRPRLIAHPKRGGAVQPMPSPEDQARWAREDSVEEFMSVDAFRRAQP
jgi:hypothetical protein